MKDTITQEAVTQYELLCPLLSGIYGELQELSKKKPDTPLNNFKVKSINRVLEPIKELLKVFRLNVFLCFPKYSVHFIHCIIRKFLL